MSMFQGLMVKPSAKHDSEASQAKSEDRKDGERGSRSTGFSFLNSPVPMQLKGSSEPEEVSTTEAPEHQGSSTSFSFIDSSPAPAPAPAPKVTGAINEGGLSGSLLQGLKIHSHADAQGEEIVAAEGGKSEAKEEVRKKSPDEGGEFGEASEEGEDPFASVVDSDDGEGDDLEKEKEKKGEADDAQRGPGELEDDKEYEFVQSEDSSPVGTDGEFGQLLAAFRRSVGKYSKEIGEMNSESVANSKKSTELEEELKVADAALFAAEASQNTASQAEDFAKAEELQKEIDALTRMKGELQSGLDKVIRKDEALQKQREQLFENQISSIETIRSLLQDCSLKESKRAEDHEKLSQEEFARKSNELKDEEDLLRMRTEHIVQDLDVLEKEEEQINAKISSGTETLREERNEWETKIGDVNTEIETLEAQLQEKYDQRKAFTEKMDTIDCEIETVKAKYKTRVSELEARRRAVESKQSEVEQGKQRIGSTRASLLEEREVEASKSKELKAMAASVVSQLVILEKISDRLREETVTRKEKMERSVEDVATMEELKDGLKVAAQTVNVLKSQLSHKESTVLELTSKLLQLENKLPSLNEQKRLAVSTRNFKQAARVAAQIKALASEKETIDEKVEEANKELHDLQVRIDKQNETMGEMSKKLESLEAELARKKLKDVLQKSRTLEDNLREVKELGSIEQGTFGGTVVQLLTTDIESCSLEASELANKLGDPSLAACSSTVEGEEAKNIETEVSMKQENSAEVSSDVPDPTESTEDLDERIAVLSAKVEQAVESEDYDLAAELEEKLKTLTDRRQARCGGKAGEKSCNVPVLVGSSEDTGQMPSKGGNSNGDAEEPPLGSEVEVKQDVEG